MKTHARIIHAIASVLLTVSLQAGEKGFAPIFNGKDLKGWDSKPGMWEVRDGEIWCTGKSKAKNWLIWRKEQPANFILRLEFRWDKGNSGVQVRSHLSKEGDPAPEGAKRNQPLPAGRLYGPQCEIAINGTAGDFWDEARRLNWWSELTETGDIRTDAAKAAFKKGEWNAYRILVEGDHYRSWVNDVPAADFRQPHDPEGHIGFQVHGIKKGTGPYTVRWRKVMFREID